MKTEDKRYHENFNEVKSRPKSCALKVKSGQAAATTTIVLLICSVSGSAQTVEGKWTTYNEQSGLPLSVIEITKTENGIEGRIAQIFLEPFQGEDPICSKCTGERKDQKVIGMNFMWDFKSEKEEWSSGKILDPQTGEVYSSKLWMQDVNTLVVRGYGGPLELFYRTQVWRRKGLSSELSPVGTWETIDDQWNKVKSMVELKLIEGELRGFVRKIFLLPSEGTDPICVECKGDLKDTRIVGMKIIWGFRSENSKWVDGKILDPGNGNVYSSSIWLLDDDTLKVRGYLGPFYRSQVWKRNKI